MNATAHFRCSSTLPLRSLLSGLGLCHALCSLLAVRHGSLPRPSSRFIPLRPEPAEGSFQPLSVRRLPFYCYARLRSLWATLKRSKPTDNFGRFASALGVCSAAAHFFACLTGRFLLCMPQPHGSAPSSSYLLGFPASHPKLHSQRLADIKNFPDSFVIFLIIALLLFPLQIFDVIALIIPPIANDYKSKIQIRSSNQAVFLNTNMIKSNK